MSETEFKDTRLEKLFSTSLGEHVINLLKNPVVTEIRINYDGKLWSNKFGEGTKMYFEESNQKDWFKVIAPNGETAYISKKLIEN